MMSFLFRNTQAQSEFQLGVYADQTRSVTCISGVAGAEFDQILWAYVPKDLALSYITIRFRFPDNIDFSRRPTFNDQVSLVVYTDYVADTVEWNMVFNGCPTGWVKVFSQRCVMLDDQPSTIEILGPNSLTRDCTFFILNDVVVLNELSINDAECTTVPSATQSWGAIKSNFR